MFKIKRHNKWQVVLTIEGIVHYGAALGWKQFIIGIIKIQTLPDNGAEINPKNYKGRLISFRFWLPFENLRLK